MKKLIILAAIATMAIASSNAASIAWKIGNISTYNTYSEASPTKIASGANYLILAFYSSDTTVSATFDGASVDAGADSLISSFAPTASGGTGTASGKKLDYDYSAGSYYYAVLYNSKGTTSTTAYDYYAISGVLTGNPAAVSPDTPLALKWTASDGYPAFETTGAVPEPTSGLLILIGCAGLALRRRRS